MNQSVVSLTLDDLLRQRAPRNALLDSALQASLKSRICGKVFSFMLNCLLKSSYPLQPIKKCSRVKKKCSKSAQEFMCNVYLAHVRPLLEFGSVIWNTGFVGDSKLLEGVQRRWTKKIDGFGDLSYGERLLRLNLYSVKGRLLRADMIKCYKIFNGLSVISPSDLFTCPQSTRTRGHRYKILKPRISIESRRRFFSVRCVDTWNSLPDGLVSSSSLDAFKSGLHQFLGYKLYEFYN